MADIFNEILQLKVKSWGSRVSYSTDITAGKNGQEARNANWQDPLRGFNAIHAVRSKADADYLFAFFQQVRGRHRGFLVKDFNDYRTRTEAGTFDFLPIHGLQIPNGARNVFQLVQLYFVQPTTGLNYSHYTIRNITRPKKGTVQIKINNALQQENTHYTVDYNTGKFTVLSVPGTSATIAIKCEFFVPARFDTDDLDLEMLHYWLDNQGEHAGVQFPEIPIVEVRDN